MVVGFNNANTCFSLDDWQGHITSCIWTVNKYFQVVRISLIDINQISSANLDQLISNEFVANFMADNARSSASVAFALVSQHQEVFTEHLTTLLSRSFYNIRQSSSILR